VSSTSIPIIYRNHSFYISGVLFGLKDIKLIRKLDVKEFTMKSLLTYPNTDAYQDNRPILMQYYLFNPTFNPDANSIVVGFPIINGLSIINEFDSIYEVKLPESKYLSNFNPFLSKENNSDFRKEFALRASYSSLVFESKNNFYIRFVKHSISDNEMELNDREKNENPEHSIMLLDKDFRLIAEYKLKNRFMDPSSFFITKNGQLYILDKEKSKRDENNQYFTVLSFKKNEN
ncbi:MAG: DUF4221 family protein, partial [Bacteroidales bacterium]|nr:DUF4221 family protein [Bacteroidales bacterium]